MRRTARRRRRWRTSPRRTSSTHALALLLLLSSLITLPPPSQHVVNKVDERFKKKYGVWIVRNERGLYVLSTVCTHLGCTPNWLDAEGKFKCPCHGSGFYATGINFEGPAPRPLERFKVRLSEDGQVFVDKTGKYQFEKGQWNDPASFLELA